MSVYLIHFCKKMVQKYCFNVFIMINIIYHFYVESELLILTYGYIPKWYHKSEFLKTMGVIINIIILSKNSYNNNNSVFIGKMLYNI